MSGGGSYSHSRGALSNSSNGSRGNNGYFNGSGGGSNYQNGMGANGITETASSSTIVAATNASTASNGRRQRRPDTEEIKRVGRIHYQELFTFLKSHLARGECGVV